MPVARQRGFSLMVVFLLVTVMVALAGTVALSTQADLSTAGQGRESRTAFYAAEYALAEGQAWLAENKGAADCDHPTPRSFEPRFITSGGDEIRWSFCVHEGTIEGFGYYGAPPKATAHLSLSGGVWEEK
jgi:hypothetical protein